MRYIDVKRQISCTVESYQKGRYTLPEMFEQITREIKWTYCIPCMDKRIEYQEKLYKYACKCAIKAIDKMQRMK